jgi:DNA-binding NtrC family response regulator
VRELRNVLERASLLCDGDSIRIEHLPQEVLESVAVVLERVGPGTASVAQSLTLAEMEEATLRQRLHEHGGNRRTLAAALGISERTLYRRLKKILP